MRTLVLVAVCYSLIAVALTAPYVGALVWTWVSIMNPQRLVWAAEGWRFSELSAIVTLVSWLVSREPKRIHFDTTMILVTLLVIWITVCTITSLAQAYSWSWWDLHIRNFALFFPIIIIMNNRTRIHALVWIIVLSVGYYGVKGGGFTLLTGGGDQVLGPEQSAIEDRNHLAVALCLILPLMNYLREHSAQRLVRIGLVGAMGLTIVAVIGTYSRGGLLALGTLLFIMWLRSKNKLVSLIMMAVVVVPALSLMPQEYYDRMNTISEADQDTSFRGRLDAWEFAWNAALDRPLFGAGMAATEVAEVFQTYLPGRQQRAAHSIYFQVLGDAGFPGLMLMLAIYAAGFLNSAMIMQKTRRIAHLRWAHDLALMTQIGMFAFMVGGAALSLAYFVVPYLLVAVLANTKRIVSSDLMETHPRTRRHGRRRDSEITQKQPEVIAGASNPA